MTNEKETAPSGAPPSTVTDAVLVPSNEMPEGSQKVEELDFNKFEGRPITVDDLMSGMNNMGFQASSIGEAVRIINNMVRFVPLDFRSVVWSQVISIPAWSMIWPSGAKHIRTQLPLRSCHVSHLILS